MKKLSRNKVFSLLFALLMAGHTVAEQQKLLPQDGNTEDFFAYSVAIDGNAALVGAYKADEGKIKDTGAAYVYELTKNGWTQQAKLVASNPLEGDTLGGNVALKGNVAVLGVIGRDVKGENDGAVYVFERESGLWDEKSILTAIDGKSGDAFGQSIALTDRTLVIGAPRSDAPAKDSGSAYVFEKANGKWQFLTKLIASDGEEGDLFGISVAIDGDTILVGADLDDDKAENAGAVYAYVFDGKQWQQQAKLMASDAGNTDIFGVRVALSGDTALISARRDDDESKGVDAGSAYLFERDGTNWTQQMKLLAPDGKEDDRFGRGVAINNDTAIVSAMHHDAKGDNAGAVYVYKKQSGNWTFASKFYANKGKPEDKFGWNVALSNDFAIIAAPFRDDNGEESGAAFIQLITN